MKARVPRAPSARRSYPFPFYRRRRVTPWPEFVASGVATVTIFIGAIVSMTSVSSAPSRARDLEARPQTTVTFLTPAKEPERPREKPPQVRRPARAATTAAPTPQVAELTVVNPPTPPATPVDTGATKPAPPVRLTDIAPPTPSDRIEFRAAGPSSPRSGLGAAAAPAGLTDKSRGLRAAGAMSPHDSAVAAQAQLAHDVARWSTMSSGAKSEIAESQREVTKMAQRVGTAGNSGDVHVMSGQGKDGVGAVGGGGLGGSISLPLFSRGKSREERARDSVIDAGIRAGLARSAAIVAARRDSIRADSIRADSARKVAQSRKPTARRDSL